MGTLNVTAQLRESAPVPMQRDYEAEWREYNRRLANGEKPGVDVACITWGLLMLGAIAFVFLALHIDPRELLLVIPTWGIK